MFYFVIRNFDVAYPLLCYYRFQKYMLLTYFFTSGFTVGGKISISLMDEDQVKSYHANERLEMHKILDKYTRTCEHAGVNIYCSPK